MAQPSSQCSLSGTKENVNKPNKPKLIELPKEMIERILLEVAQKHYESLYTIAKTCHKLKAICDEFIERHPVSMFKSVLPVGDESEEEEWNYDDSSDASLDHDPDDLDDINDLLERFSYGSNYDEDLDDLLNGSSEDNYAAHDGGEAALASGEEPNAGDNVTDGW